TTRLQAEVLPPDADQGLLWTSLSPGTISVDSSGNLRGLAEGAVSIVAASKADPSLKDTLSVKAAVPSAVSSITISPKTMQLYAGGDAGKVTATVVFTGQAGGANFTTSNKDIADVGVDGKVTPIAAGSVIIIAHALGSSALADTCKVTVSPMPLSALSDLSLSKGTLTPKFAAGTLAYTASVPYETASLTVTATGAGSLSVNQEPVVSANASGPIALLPAPSENIVKVAVQALNSHKNTYTITVKREGGDSNATLTSLSPSIGSLAPIFVGTSTAYTLSVPFSTASIAFTAKAASTLSTLAMNGVAVVSGNASAPIVLNVSPKKIDVVVTAQSGAKKTYSVTVTKAAASAENALKNLTGSVSVPAGGGSLTFKPAINPTDSIYTVELGNTATEVKLTPIAKDSTATITVNGKPTTSGAASAGIALMAPPANNQVPLVVTAENGNARTYWIRFRRTQDVGFMIDFEGGIAKTEDGGDTWTMKKVLPGSNSVFNDITFTDVNTGFATGFLGEIYRTIDRGETWLPMTSGVSQSLYAINFPDKNTGIAVGYDGVVTRTGDGGTTWTAGAVATLEYFSCVHFPDASTGYAGSIGGVIYKTINGGASWTALVSGVTEPLYSMWFTSAQTGVAVGWGGTLIRTTNGGATWTPVTGGGTNNLNSVTFTSASVGYIAGGENMSGGTGIVLKTTNGGASWTTQYTKTGSRLNRIQFLDANRGIILGDGSLLVETRNAGVDWIEHADNLNLRIHAFRFLSY
ncbi:MAG: cadherin-like beta sandwich domain-containing protein, partial [Fibrobacteria bacterium]